MALNLLKKRAVIWTVAPDARVAAAYADYRALGDEPPAAHEAASEWAGERSRLLHVLEKATVEEARFELSTITPSGSGRYQAAMRRFTAWYEAQHGASILKDLAGPDGSDELAAAVELYNAAHGFAAIVASLTGYQERVRPYLDGDNAAWREQAGPEWTDYVAFEATVPQALALELSEAAHAVNPGLWSLSNPPDDVKKMIGGVRDG